jgi:hypothetical protein
MAGSPAETPEWLAHRYDPVGDRVQFVEVPRARHAEIPFLTDEYLPGAKTPRVLGRPAAMAEAAVSGPLHFIFHSAFCCSTLLVRALDDPGLAMGLSEPVILNDIMGWRLRDRPDGPRIGAVLDDALTLLARPFGPGEAVIVKPSNLVNPLAHGLLQMRPEARALLLHTSLDGYLGSIARKGMWGRLWVRDLLAKLLPEGIIDLGLAGDDYLRLTDIQAAAVGWLAQHAHFAKLAGRFGPARVRTLDSDVLLARPQEALLALGQHFGLGIDSAMAARLAAGPAFGRNSKSGEAFGAADRAADRSRGLEAHGEEIGMVLEWARAVAANAGVALVLPNSLLP